MAIVADLVADPLKPRIRLKPVGAARGEDDSARAAERRRIDRGEGMLMEPLHTASGTKRRRLDDGDEDSSGTKRRLLDDGDEDCLDGDEGSRAVKRRRLDGDEGSRTVKRRSLDGDEGSPPVKRRRLDGEEGSCAIATAHVLSTLPPPPGPWVRPVACTMDDENSRSSMRRRLDGDEDSHAIKRRAWVRPWVKRPVALRCTKDNDNSQSSMCRRLKGDEDSRAIKHRECDEPTRPPAGFLVAAATEQTRPPGRATVHVPSTLPPGAWVRPVALQCTKDDDNSQSSMRRRLEGDEDSRAIKRRECDEPTRAPAGLSVAAVMEQTRPPGRATTHVPSMLPPGAWVRPWVRPVALQCTKDDDNSRSSMRRRLEGDEDSRTIKHRECDEPTKPPAGLSVTAATEQTRPLGRATHVPSTLPPGAWVRPVTLQCTKNDDNSRSSMRRCLEGDEDSRAIKHRECDEPTKPPARLSVTAALEQTRPLGRAAHVPSTLPLGAWVRPWVRPVALQCTKDDDNSQLSMRRRLEGDEDSHAIKRRECDEPTRPPTGLSVATATEQTRPLGCVTAYVPSMLPPGAWVRPVALQCMKDDNSRIRSSMRREDNEDSPTSKKAAHNLQMQRFLWLQRSREEARRQARQDCQDRGVQRSIHR
ncbi:hypothetical protein GUJ93_ZPchr0007g4879 [Zizania palustris]|uniref:Uncharacterized protein n=1 Tax=Zizania palustris TaxID=103762 RepID=A0A8J5TJR4_ZIZPA|nr:hypothetical protein GUJ93_ZPchr0007g4879 [Zizania palustris]